MTTCTETNFDKSIRFYPAYDKRSKDPKKNFGIHCVDVAFYFKGEKGAIQFKLSTGWYLSSVRMSTPERFPIAIDIGYHSPVPMYEGQEPIEKCEILGGKTCYYDGSTMWANKYLEVLIADGDEAVWKMLEEEYKRRFYGN